MYNLLSSAGPLKGESVSLTESGPYMRINSGVYNSVVFLGYPEPDDETSLIHKGSGFIFRYQNQNYLVTCRHVAFPDFEDCAFAMRLNNEKNKSIIHRFDGDPVQWFFPNDETIDLAATPIELDYANKWSCCEALTEQNVATYLVRRGRNIGEGDLAYIIGMHRFVQGKKRILPMVHAGYIASMAEGERIPWYDKRTKTEYDFEGYIISAYTLSGTSGSPVFVRGTYRDDSVSPNRLMPGDTTWFLGIWKGNYHSKFDQELVTAGMGTAVPATKLIDLMEQENVKQDREQRVKEKGSMKEFVEDSSADSEEQEHRRDSILETMLNTPPETKKPD